MKLAKWPLNENIDALFIPTNDGQFREIEAAKNIDRNCVANHGQLDRSHHLCALQKQHQREDKKTLEIFTSIYGFQVRDINNFGVQRYLSRGSSAVEALRFCKKWYEEKSEHRGVILGYISPEFENELNSALENLNETK